MSGDMGLSFVEISGKRSNRSAKDIFFALFLVFIPFSQALTINILFPLKISEIFLLLLIGLEIATGGLLKWRMKKPIAITILSFIAIVLISVIVNLFYNYPYPLAVEFVRVSQVVDSILKYFYILLAVAAFYITANELKRKPEHIKYFFLGAVLSSAYCWYLFVSGVLHLPVILLPGLDGDQTFNVGFGDIIRTGTFKEGNYMGFYLLVSGILAVYYKRRRLAIFLFLTMITTFSSTAALCSLIFFAYYIVAKYKRYKIKLVFMLAVFVVVISLLIQFSAGFRTIFYNKIFGSADTVENANDLYSKADRLNTATVALDIAMNNPVFGVGPANYGLHYNHYNDVEKFEQKVKKIPNNIYVEVLSECGLFAFILFAAFLVNVFICARRKSPEILGAGLLAAFVYFFAFPTFTMLFIWVFLGIAISDHFN